MSMSVDNKDDDTTSSSCHHHLERLNNASKNAIQIVNRFANIEPPVSSKSSAMSIDNIKNDNTEDDNNNKNPWRNPKLIEKELNIVRNELNDAWMDLKKNQNTKGSLENDDNDADDDDEMVFSETEFRVQYMDMITDAFGDILDEMNKKQQNEEESNINSDTNFDVDILVDCLQSGIDFLDPTTEYKKQSYFNSLVLPLDNDNDTTMNDDEENKNENEQQLTIHQMKQRSLGYLTC